jgi:hypothetical protein
MFDARTFRAGQVFFGDCAAVAEGLDRSMVLEDSDDLKKGGQFRRGVDLLNRVRALQAEPHLYNPSPSSITPTSTSTTLFNHAPEFDMRPSSLLREGRI